MSRLVTTPALNVRKLVAEGRGLALIKQSVQSMLTELLVQLDTRLLSDLALLKHDAEAHWTQGFEPVFIQQLARDPFVGHEQLTHLLHPTKQAWPGDVPVITLEDGNVSGFSMEASTALGSLGEWGQAWWDHALAVAACRASYGHDRFRCPMFDLLAGRRGAFCQVQPSECSCSCEGFTSQAVTHAIRNESRLCKHFWGRFLELHCASVAWNGFLRQKARKLAT